VALRRRNPEPRPVRLTLLAALCWARQTEIIDGLVDLLIILVHKVDATADAAATRPRQPAWSRLLARGGLSMLVNPTIDKLQALGLGAMATALVDQLATPGPWDELSFTDRLGLLVDREADARDSRRLATRLKAAKLRYGAAVEDIDFRSPRGLNRSNVLALAQAGWVARHHNLVVTGPTGVGKSFVACALANGPSPGWAVQRSGGADDDRRCRRVQHRRWTHPFVRSTFLLAIPCIIRVRSPSIHVPSLVLKGGYCLAPLVECGRWIWRHWTSGAGTNWPR